MPEMSSLLHFAEHPLQIGCKLFMLTAYTCRIIQLFSFKAGMERQAPTGLINTSVGKGVAYSMVNVAMPWSMESTRTKFLFYLQFVIFHLAAAAAIGLTFIIPYGPGLLKNVVLVQVLQVLMGAGCVIGFYRLCRRIFNPYIRAISSPDDYFSVGMLTIWLFFGMMAAPNDLSQGEGYVLTYFLITAFFLIYVPFSKIMHYLWYPFTRYYFGKSMGYRGVYPVRHDSQPATD
ncbi:MAG: hypothetical protein ACYTF1_08485 [Planctomycetota bacterium]|jgi:hypothetical protein